MAATQDIKFEWDDTQLEAINRCCDMAQRIVPITGVAGTGKTTIIREVYQRLTDAGYDVVLCAPTGKAVKRITEATGIKAKTIHRMLEYPFPGDRDEKTGEALVSTDPKRDKKNPLAEKVILADEYAMVSHELHRNLIYALPPGGRVCMFGDVNQLKPIEKGPLALKRTPFEEALRRFEGVTLLTFHRQEAGSGIISNGDMILKGRVPMRKPDFSMKITDRPVDELEQFVIDMIDNRGINFGSSDGQIISPTKKSWVGTHKLNVMLQRVFNSVNMRNRIELPRHEWQTSTPISVAIGDKVIWTQNSYDLRDVWDRYIPTGDMTADGKEIVQHIPTPVEKSIMNGESGIITDIDETGIICIDVGDRVVEIPPHMTILNKKNQMIRIDPRKDLDLGYCITTHKAQGSEWPYVCYVLNKSTAFMQSRNNMYTAISRARRHVHLICDQRSLQTSVVNTMTSVEFREKRKAQRT